jgi:hypothetical protein
MHFADIMCRRESDRLRRSLCLEVRKYVSDSCSVRIIGDLVLSVLSVLFIHSCRLGNPLGSKVASFGNGAETKFISKAAESGNWASVAGERGIGSYRACQLAHQIQPDEIGAMSAVLPSMSNWMRCLLSSWSGQRCPGNSNTAWCYRGFLPKVGW